MKVRVMIVREGRPTMAEMSSPQAVFKYMRPKCRRLDREHFWRIDVDARSKVLGYEVVSIGTISASLVHRASCSRVRSSTTRRQSSSRTTTRPRTRRRAPRIGK